MTMPMTAPNPPPDLGAGAAGGVTDTGGGGVTGATGGATGAGACGGIIGATGCGVTGTTVGGTTGAGVGIVCGGIFLKLVINIGGFYRVECCFERGFGGSDGVVGSFNRRADFCHFVFWGCACDCRGKRRSYSGYLVLCRSYVRARRREQLNRCVHVYTLGLQLAYTAVDARSYIAEVFRIAAQTVNNVINADLHRLAELNLRLFSPRGCSTRSRVCF